LPFNKAVNSAPVVAIAISEFGFTGGSTTKGGVLTRGGVFTGEEVGV